MKSNVVPIEEYDKAIELNRKLLQENTDLKIQVSHLQKELTKAKEVKFYAGTN